MFRLILSVVLTITRFTGPALEAQDPKAGAFTSTLAGEWNGTLEYRDYSTEKRVTLPTTLVAKPAADGRSVTLKFRYDEGKNRFVESTDTFRLDANRSTLTWESENGKTSEYQLAGLEAFAEPHQGDLVLSGKGIENKVDVEVRQTITLKGDELTLLKETRKPGSEFAFRNVYKFRRSVKP